MKWSFSSVNNYSNCPKCFFLSYIYSQDHKIEKVNNAMAQFGSFCHSILEKYYLGELDFFELSQAYEEGYSDNVTEPFPFNKWKDLQITYHEDGQDYFDNFEGDFEDCEILGVEQRIDIPINGIPFVGYIDLLLKNNEGYIICDHKSKSGFKNKVEESHYLRQLYLYSLYVKEKYGEYPKKLIFNMFRKNEKVEIEFEKSALDDAVKWFTDTIDQIYRDSKFEDKIKLEYKDKGKKLSQFHKDDFFCNNLCGVRPYCNRSKSYDKTKAVNKK